MAVPRARKRDVHPVVAVLRWLRAHLMTVLVTLMAGYFLWAVTGRVDDNSRQLEAQVEGRKVAIDVLCGIGSGFGQAGRLIVLNDSGEWLEALGKEEYDRLRRNAPFPPPSTQQRDAREALARAYNVVAAKAIIREAGVEARGLLWEDGTVNCEVLKHRARATEHRDDR